MMAALAIYLWLVGAWGLYDLYDAHGDNDHDGITIMCCLFWPIIIPVALIVEVIALVTKWEWRRGSY